MTERDENLCDDKTEKKNADDLNSDFKVKCKEVMSVLKKNLIGCDAKWTLFVAAALSYRFGANLSPFPPYFVNEECGNDITSLMSVINETPCLRLLMQDILDEDYENVNAEVLKLVHWLLVEHKTPKLNPLTDEEIFKLFGILEQHNKTDPPTHVFEVLDDPNSDKEKKFKALVGNKTPEYAFYGARLECFYTAITNGFIYHENTLDLSTELPVSLLSSPLGAGWGNSFCGAMISCVGICEFINDPNFVKCKVVENVPGTDVFVEDKSLVRLRYLIFYGCRFDTETKQKPNNIMLWMQRHSKTLIYAGLMIFVYYIGAKNYTNSINPNQIEKKTAGTLVKFIKKILFAA